MTGMVEAQQRELGRDLAARGKSAPDEVSAALDRQREILSGSRRQWDAGRDTRLPGVDAVKIEGSEYGHVVVDISGELSSWCLDLPALVARIRWAESVCVRLNCTGGDDAAGLAVYTALREREGETRCEIELALSAGAIVAMGCRQRAIKPAGWIGIHSGAVAACGNAQWLRDRADQLDRISAGQAALFAEATGWPVAACAEWFKDHAYFFNAKDAIAARLAHTILTE